jgi:hypothetical protein
VFDNSGNFTHGIYHNPDPQYFYNIKDFNIEIALSNKSFKSMLYNVRNNWIDSMYAVNKYFEGDNFKVKINYLVNKKIVSDDYLLK